MTLFFERPKSGERAILVHIDFVRTKDQQNLTEFKELALSAGTTPVSVITSTRVKPDAKYFMGSGKAQEIAAAAKATQADVVLINHTLSASQSRNLETLIGCRVLDRTELILDIFAQRAQTFEGKLQVELAQLQHMATRLVRGWTHLERQKGGIGLRGPGETQLETDRRLVRVRIKAINKQLDKVRQQRAESRKARTRAEVPTVSLVGYTNAGKSTLFNQLTQAEVYVADQLFATLDPTLRRLNLSQSGIVLLADTVGFISHLPHQLVEAFRATLEETAQADLLLHVIDSSSEQYSEQIEQVQQVLKDIKADHVPSLKVFNKIDLTAQASRVDRDESGKPIAVWLSAVTGMGIDLLKHSIDELLAEELIEKHLVLTADEARLRAQLYAKRAVIAENIDDAGSWKLHVRMSKREFVRLSKP